MVNGSDDAGEADLVLAVVLAGLAVADHVRDSLVAEGIVQVRFSHLFIFARLERGPATIGEIANEMRFSHQAASTLVNQLEGAGLARRCPNPDDGRSRLVELTSGGQNALRLGMAARDGLLERLRAHTSDEELAVASTVVADLLRLTGGIDNVRIRDLGLPRPD